MGAAPKAAPTIKVGRQKLALAEPGDLAGALAPAGVSPVEMKRLVEGAAVAGLVAAALLPFLRNPLPKSELARAIAAEGVVVVRKRVARLYTEARLAPKKDSVNG